MLGITRDPATSPDRAAKKRKRVVAHGGCTLEAGRITRVCGREEAAPSSLSLCGIIYGATCKVRKITPASAGLAETTLLYATAGTRAAAHRCGSAGRSGTDDVFTRESLN